MENCAKCGGAVFKDADEWRCWQCGRYYLIRPDSMDIPEEVTNTGLPRTTSDDNDSGHGASRAVRSINSRITAGKSSDRQWWSRYRDVIRCLDQGLSIREIAIGLELGERQIRVVRQRLDDLRSSTKEQRLT